MNKKWLKKISGAILAVAMVAATAVTAFAAEEPGLPDMTRTDGSITVHKYASASSSQVPGDGLQITDPSGLGTALDNVGFTLWQVDSSYEVTAATTVDEAKANATSLGEVLTEGGVAEWTNLAMGYYVLEETPPPTPNEKYEPAAPAIITLPMGITSTGRGWNYNVHVYPKNVKTDDITKEVVAAAAQYNVGDTVSWKIDAKIKANLVANAVYGSMTVTDVLDARLTYTEDSDVVTAMGGKSAPLALARGVDYTVDTSIVVNPSDEMASSVVTWALTEAGMDKVAADGSTSLSISFDTVVNINAQDGTPPGSPSITNGASVAWDNVTDNGDGTSTVDPVTPAEIAEEDKASIDLAGIEIIKVDSQDTTILLNGAEFKIALTEAQAQSGDFLKRGANDTEDIVIITGDNPSTTDSESGWAMFTGLPLAADHDTNGTTFYLVETKAPSGYVLRQSIVQVTIAAGSKKVTTEVLNQKIGDPPLDEDRPTFQLPATGGIGTTLFIIVGVALMAGAVILLVKSRKKNKGNQ
ncbi:SpaH/EbpB family LPXTG-anchored major pilin [Ruminococcaceae bacterium OttesenSCG-928-A16]|nr:SpaH/EbpB family LPXTG-anchored major pilin [Ruminococcaceae bacterium OttesenSCG-928-A16]